MLEIIMQLSIILGIAIVVYAIYRYSKNLTYSVNKDLIISEYISLHRGSTVDKEIAGILLRIKIELHSSKVALMRFHNGGKFANGFDMKKFTTTHETASDSIEPFMDRCTNILNSRYPIAFEMLGITGQFFVSDVDDCIDLNFKADMKKYGFKSCYLFLIRQIDGKEEGFVGVNFNTTNVLNQEQRSIIIENIPTLLSLINTK